MSAYDRYMRSLEQVAAEKVQRIKAGDEGARPLLAALFWSMALLEEAKEQGLLPRLQRPAKARRLRLREAMPRPKRLFTRRRLIDFSERLAFQGHTEAADAARTLAELIPAEFVNEEDEVPA